MSTSASFDETLFGLKRWRQMYELLQSFSKNPESVNDEEIEMAWNSYRGSLQTNCESAAEALLAGMSSICYHRPDLMEKMLPEALEPLFMLGCEDAESIINWARIFSENPDPYMSRPDDAAIAWIQKIFCHADEAIEAALLTLQEEE